VIGWLWLGLPLLAAVAYWSGQRRAMALVADVRVEIHSLPAHYGQLVLVWAALPPLLILLVWTAIGSGLVDAWSMAAVEASGRLAEDQTAAAVVADVHSGMSLFDGADASPAHGEARAAIARARGTFGAAVAGLVAVSGAAGLAWARRRITPELRARNQVERILGLALMACSVVAILTTIGIVLSVLFESLRFFQTMVHLRVPVRPHWSPQTALRADQVGSSGALRRRAAVRRHAADLFDRHVVAVPVGLLSAIYLANMPAPAARNWVKPLLEILAGHPDRRLRILRRPGGRPDDPRPARRSASTSPRESALAAGLVMGIMIIPFVSSLSDDVINAVPQALRDGAYALGATQSETVKQGDPPGGAARHRRRHPAGDLARHRRDHDRGDGRGPVRQPDGQSARCGDHGDGADRDAAVGDQEFDSPQDARRVRARPGAVRRDAAAERLRPAHRAEVPGAI
jgi:phosphate transport system permease protein